MHCGVKAGIIPSLEVCYSDMVSNVHWADCCLPPGAHLEPIRTLLNIGKYMKYIFFNNNNCYNTLPLHFPTPTFVSSFCSLFLVLFFLLYLIFSPLSSPLFLFTSLSPFSPPLPLSHLSPSPPPLPLLAPSFSPSIYLSMTCKYTVPCKIIHPL